MKSISGIMALTLTSAVAILSANAADLGGYKDAPYIPPPTWMGFYLGASVGGEWQTTSFTDTLHSASLTPSGFIGGGQLGYNFQSGHLVFGPEIDIGGISVSKFKDYGDARYKNDSNAAADFTGRLGYAFGPALIYVKGGASVVSIEDQARYTATGNSYSRSKDAWGWTLGGGYEYLLSPKWSIKFEYKYFEFEGLTLAKAPADGGGFVKLGTTSANAATFGFNYHVGPTYTPLK